MMRVHGRDEFGFAERKPRVRVQLLLKNRLIPLFVVMPRSHNRLSRKTCEDEMEALVKSLAVPDLKIRTTSPANEECVPSEDLTAVVERYTLVGVPRGAEHLEEHLSEWKLLASMDDDILRLGGCELVPYDRSVGLLLEFFCTRNMICMRVGLDDVLERKSIILEIVQVSFSCDLRRWIDQCRLFGDRIIGDE